jgi:signal transduction histidine kinase/HAMP domain-containing protein
MLLGTVALLLVFALGVTRSVSRPVRRVSEAAWGMASGDLAIRVPEDGRGEFRILGRAFNSMATSLEDGRRKLNDYAVELEVQQLQLERSNHELAREKERVETLRRFGDRLAREMRVAALGRLILEGMCTAAGAEVGTLYALDAGNGTLRFAAGVGADADDVPARLSASDGLVGLALGERRAIAASYGTTAPSHLGEATSVQRELYVPLLPGDRAVGVVTVGRVGDTDFSADERAAVEHLADQAAVALSNVVSLQRARHQATINRAVLDATPDAVGLFDTRGGTVLENASMTEVRAQVEAMGENDGRTGVTTMDPATYEAALEAAGADPDRTANDEATLGDRHLQRYTAPVRDDGELVGRIVVLRDVTAEREADRLKEEFFALVSHELRTPLTSILGYVDLVLEEDQDEPLDPHVRRSLEVVDRNAERLLRLVGDLLFAAQFEAGTLALEAGTIGLDALAAESVQAARPRAEAKGVELVLDSAAPPLQRCVGDRDRDRMAQTFDNLIANAVKFTPTGGRGTVRVREEGECALIEVEDTGIGIPAGEQGRLFERFFRASTATDGAIPGVGLGLTIVKAIVEGHGGRIAVSSEEGAGTRFRILFPLRAPVERSPSEEVAR